MLIASFTDFDTAGWPWPHFSPRELACRCGGKFCRGEYWHDEAFLDALETLRADMGAPLAINSGHRCDLWNAWVGGAANSMHKRIAADVSLAGHDRHALKTAAQQAGFTGFGLGTNFLHIDRRAVPAVWVYPGSARSWRT